MTKDERAKLCLLGIPVWYGTADWVDFDQVKFVTELGNYFKIVVDLSDDLYVEYNS